VTRKEERRVNWRSYHPPSALSQTTGKRIKLQAIENNKMEINI
jgi:hypothetical protein